MNASVTLEPSVPVEVPAKKIAPSIRLPESRDNSAALKLLDEWMADESGYDEQVWPKVKQLIEENRLSDRKRFCE